MRSAMRSAMSGDYPETVIEVIDDQMTFSPAVIAAAKSFAESGPWRGSLRQRKRKFHDLLLALAEAYGIATPMLRFGRMDGTFSGDSHYSPGLNQILLVGRPSVISFLHEVGHALGLDERGACRFSVNLFRRIWPKQFGRLIHRGHVVVRPSDVGSRESHPAQAKKLVNGGKKQSLMKALPAGAANSSPVTVRVREEAILPGGNG